MLDADRPDVIEDLALADDRRRESAPLQLHEPVIEERVPPLLQRREVALEEGQVAAAHRGVGDVLDGPLGLGAELVDLGEPRGDALRNLVG
jgi:hypothetical protein